MDLEIITTHEVLSELEDEQAEELRRYRLEGELTVINLGANDRENIRTMNFNVVSRKATNQ